MKPGLAGDRCLKQGLASPAVAIVYHRHGSLGLIMKFLLNRKTTNPRGLSFYICADQDDWIYFRGEWAFRDLRLHRSVVVFLTAGDAQCTDGWWQLRELAATSAFENAVGQPARLPVARRVQGHRILRRQYGQSAMWFLRLPNRSDVTNPPPQPGLQELYRGMASRVCSIDGTASYTSWDDLCGTLEEIVTLETRQAGVVNPFVNAPLYESDSVTNPGDHEEHTLTGLAVKSFARRYPRAWWYGYCIGDHIGERNWTIDSAAMYRCKLRLWTRYRNVIDHAMLKAGNTFSPCARRWVANRAIDKEWHRWGACSHARLMNAGDRDSDPSNIR